MIVWNRKNRAEQEEERVQQAHTSLSAAAFACSSFLDFEGAPSTFGLESLRVTVRLNTMEGDGDVAVLSPLLSSLTGGKELSLSTTKNPSLSNYTATIVNV